MPVQAPEALYRVWLGRERAAGRAGKAPWTEAQSFRTSTRKPPMLFACSRMQKLSRLVLHTWGGLMCLPCHHGSLPGVFRFGSPQTYCNGRPVCLLRDGRASRLTAAGVQARSAGVLPSREGPAAHERMARSPVAGQSLQLCTMFLSHLCPCPLSSGNLSSVVKVMAGLQGRQGRPELVQAAADVPPSPFSKDPRAAPSQSILEQQMSQRLSLDAGHVSCAVPY